MLNPSAAGSLRKSYRFKSALQADGWISPAYISTDENGLIESVSGDPPIHISADDLETVEGLAVPGFQNAHSHAFQYAMAGMAETHQPGTSDDFWSWRESMYQCALTMDPSQIQTVATALYIELLKKGYTSVAEFHYLHHDKNGKQYSNKSETSVALIAAAAVAGIRITLIPVFYQKGGFGKEAVPRQRRFTFRSPDEYFELLAEAHTVVKKITTASLGYGVHSLRAADPADVKEIFASGPRHLPFHLHAAEQLKEVEDCLAFLKARPVAWILENLPVDNQFNLVHCTHMNDEEIAGLSKTGANVVLCPGTEGNLGDGFFRLREYEASGGNWCIGTDSHISLNPLEDLRWLDYGQRLQAHKRNTFNDGGLTMVRKSFLNGQKAMGRNYQEFFHPGQPMDAVVYDCRIPLITERDAKYCLPRILYTSDSSAVLGTIVNGQWIVKHGHHREEESIRESFRKTLHNISIL